MSCTILWLACWKKHFQMWECGFHSNPYNGQSFIHCTADFKDGARLYVAVDTFGAVLVRGYTSVPECLTLQAHLSKPVPEYLLQQEWTCKGNVTRYQVRDVEFGCFPLVFSTAGGMGPIAKMVYKQIASLTSEKLNKPYSIYCKARPKYFVSARLHKKIWVGRGRNKIYWGEIILAF